MKSLRDFFKLEKIFLEKLKIFFSWDQFKDFYQYVKAFWIDFFKEAKRGTQAHLKGIKIFLLFSIIVFIILLGTVLKFTADVHPYLFYNYLKSLQLYNFFIEYVVTNCMHKILK